ncbi:hypothetical protein T484DRAFT_1956287 [Baffinella frigidus]|nr:hypothetical protein T484DRAFT_1956287 [Cryptophyta sp. CCMP2293]
MILTLGLCGVLACTAFGCIWAWAIPLPPFPVPVGAAVPPPPSKAVAAAPPPRRDPKASWLHGDTYSPGVLSSQGLAAMELTPLSGARAVHAATLHGDPARGAARGSGIAPRADTGISR